LPLLRRHLRLHGRLSLFHWSALLPSGVPWWRNWRIPTAPSMHRLGLSRRSVLQWFALPRSRRILRQRKRRIDTAPRLHRLWIGIRRRPIVCPMCSLLLVRRIDWRRRPRHLCPRLRSELLLRIWLRSLLLIRSQLIQRGCHEFFDPQIIEG
jgi:hypothetical protein